MPRPAAPAALLCATLTMNVACGTGEGTGAPPSPRVTVSTSPAPTPSPSAASATAPPSSPTATPSTSPPATDRALERGYRGAAVPNVPADPASHRCVRVSLAAIKWLWQKDRVPIGATVWVY